MIKLCILKDSYEQILKDYTKSSYYAYQVKTKEKAGI